MHEMIWGDSIPGNMGCIRTILVAASERFLSVHRQFCTSLWLWCPRCIASACIPPGKIIFLIIHATIISCCNSLTASFDINLVFFVSYLLQQWRVYCLSRRTEPSAREMWSKAAFRRYTNAWCEQVLQVHHLPRWSTTTTNKSNHKFY